MHRLSFFINFSGNPLSLINGPLYLVPTDKLQVVDRAISNVCQVPVVDQLCESFFFLLCGANYDSNDPVSIVLTFGIYVLKATLTENSIFR